MTPHLIGAQDAGCEFPLAHVPLGLVATCACILPANHQGPHVAVVTFAAGPTDPAWHELCVSAVRKAHRLRSSLILPAPSAPGPS